MAKFGIMNHFSLLSLSFIIMTIKLHPSITPTPSIALTAIMTALLLIGCNQNSSTNTDNTTATSDQTQGANAEPINNAPAHNDDPNHQPDVALALQNNLNNSGLNAQVQSVILTDMPEMYWATLDGFSPFFVDKTGTYVIQGAVMKLGDGGPVDISSAMMSKAAVSELQAVDKSEMIVFPAKGETKASIYVFSDPTCHYCQLLHKEIDQTNAAGIEVRYLAWPRGDSMVGLTERVWCSSDRQAALTDAKKGKNITASSCDNPVRKHMALGQRLGVSGTPAVFAENGQQLGGYLPSAELAKQAIANR